MYCCYLLSFLQVPLNLIADVDLERISECKAFAAAILDAIFKIAQL